MSQIYQLDEHEQEEVSLTCREYQILKEKFGSRVGITEIQNGRYLLRSRQFVGNIVLPEHTIIIRPKIPNLNFFMMLMRTYELIELKEEEFLYPQDREIFELVLSVFLSGVEKLVKSGMSKDYLELEDNSRRVRGRILITQDIRSNPVLRDRVYCRYSEFGADTSENRILKFTLFKLSQMQVQDGQLNKTARAMFHYFEPVSLTHIDSRNWPRIFYNRLNQRYRPILNLAKLILENSSLNLQETGKIEFSSFLVDMNLLFERFLLSYLKERLKDFVIKGASRLGGPYTLDEQGELGRNPDIVIKKGNRPLLVMDAKYKVLLNTDTDTIDSDVNQVLSYTFAVGVPMGILVYPKCEGSTIADDGPRKIKGTEKRLSRRVVDLTQRTKEEFYRECDKLVECVRDELKGLTLP